MTDPADPPLPRLVCAWCFVTLRDGAAASVASHGICALCAGAGLGVEVESLSSAPPGILDALPFGTVRLDPAGVVLSYNAAESEISGRARESVIGRNFFTEVAPCTSVRELRGLIDVAVAKSDNLLHRMEFTFAFPSGAVRVKLVLLYEVAPRVTTVLVSRLR